MSQRHKQHPRLRAALLLLGLILGTAFAASTPSSPASAAVGGKRAVVLPPFTGGATTGNQSPDVHAVTSLWGFAWDIHGGASTAVYPRVSTSDGTLSMTVSGIWSDSVGAGDGIDLEVKVDGTVVGHLRFNHLVGRPAGLTVGAAVTTSTTLGNTAPNTSYTNVDGTCVGFPCNSHWFVYGATGIHTHMEFQQGCYNTPGISVAVGAGTGIAMLSSNYGTTNKSACDAAELSAVLAGQSPTGSSPSAFVDPTYGRQVFVVGGDNAVYQWSVSGTHWVSFRLGGSVMPGTSPAAINDSVYGRQVYYTGSDSHVHQFSVSGGAWVDVDMGGSVRTGTSPTATSDTTYGQQVFYNGTDGKIHQLSVSGTVWVDFGMAVSSPAASTSPSATSDGTYGRQIFYTGTDNKVHQISVSGGAWADFPMGGSVKAGTSPSATVDSVNGRNIFFTASDSSIHQFSVSGTWVDFPMGGVAVGSPRAVVDPLSGRNIFFVGGDSAVYRWSVISGAWAQVRLGGSVNAGTVPAATFDSTNGTNVFYSGSPSIKQLSFSGGSWVDFLLS